MLELVMISDCGNLLFMIFGGAVPKITGCTDIGHNITANWSPTDFCEAYHGRKANTPSCNPIIEPEFTSINVEFGLLCDDANGIKESTSVQMIGYVVGSLFWGQFSDMFGRKMTMMVTLIANGILGSISGFVPDLTTFTILRIFISLFFTGHLVIDMVYFCETIPTKHRLWLAFVLNWSPNFIVVAIIAWFCGDWRVFSVALNVICFAAAGLMCFCAEPPHWLLRQGKIDEARKVVKYIYKFDGAELDEESLEQMLVWEQRKLELLPKERFWFPHLFCTWKLCGYTAAVFLSYFQASFVQYALLFNMEDIGGSIFVNTMVMGVLRVVINLFSAAGDIFLPWLGRKKAHKFFCLYSGVTLVIALGAEIFGASGNWSNVIRFMLLSTASMVCQMFAVVSVVCNEIFPTPIRNVAYAMTQIAESSAAALGPLVFILNGVGQWLPLMLMTIIVFADLIVFHFLVPETKDLPLADAMPDGGVSHRDIQKRQLHAPISNYLVLKRRLGSRLDHPIISICYNYLEIAAYWTSLWFLKSACLGYSCERICQRIRKRFFAAILSHEIECAQERLKEGFGEKFANVFYYGTQCFAAFGIGFYYDWRLTLVMMTLTPVVATAGFMFNKLATDATALSVKWYSKAGKVAEEALSSIRTVLSFNGQEHECQKFEKNLADGSRVEIKRAVMIGALSSISFSCFDVMYCVAFYVGTDYVYWGFLSPQTMVTVLMTVKFGSYSLGYVIPEIATVINALGQAGGIMEIIDSVRTPEGCEKPPFILGKVAVRNVHFTYPSRPDVPILKGISFDCDPGQTVALVGSSGSGKSTIVQLLLRYYQLELGQLTIDGIPVEDYDIDYLRKIVGVVSQEPVLFNNTILENLLFGNPNATDKDINSALKKANALGFINEFPEGLKTLVGDRGTQMSGGQKQRIAIARALLRDPKILLLDEATSALDAESETVVQQALENASRGRTTIVIAHRLSTIRNADKIVVIRHGEVVETGRHSELMEARGHYFDLVNAQVFADVETTPTKTNYLRQRSNRFSTGSDSVDDNDPAHRNLDTIDEHESEMDRLKREIEEEGVETVGLWKIMKYIGPEMKFFWMGVICASLEGTLYPLYGLFYTKAFEIFSEPDQELMRYRGHMAALAFLLMMVLDLTFPSLGAIGFGVVASRVTERLRSLTFRNVLSQSAAYFDSPKHSAGKISTRLATDAPNIKQAVDLKLGQLLRGIVALLAGLAGAFYFSWHMSLLMLTIIPIITIAEYFWEKSFGKDTVEDMRLMEASGKVAMESIESIRTVHALSLQGVMHSKYCALIERPFKTNKRKAIVQGLMSAVSTGMQPLTDAMQYRFGAWLIARNMIVNPFDAWRAQFCLQYASYAMLKQETAIDGMKRIGFKSTSGKVEFESLRFAYPERSDVEVLKGVSFTIEPGQTVAVVGPSGCGKSTLVGLLQRFYDVADGAVKIDGQDIRTMGAADVRGQMAVVAQEPILFDDSIKNNIIYGLDAATVTESDAVEAAKKANIHSFIAGLPLGYDTTVGDKGTQLSGGQKQRVAIARALVRNPKILILDEATSALDTESEKVVQEALDAASEGRTCLVIAHRLSTIRNAHKIVVMRAGEIVEQGNHQELIAMKGAYYRLVLQQERRRHSTEGPIEEEIVLE
ncbi:unnamed protein product, partial [Mesorhabditis spiculigera]